MLSLVLRRAGAQKRLLAGVIALVTLGTTLLGVGALLLGETQDRAFTTAVQAKAPRDVDVTAYMVGLKGADQVSVRDAARSIVRNALRPLESTLTTIAVSRMRRLGDSGRIGYFASTDSLTKRSTLTAGRWPSGPGEAVVLDKTATQMDFALGSRITLGKEIGTAPMDNTVSVVVVGTIRAASGSGWDADTLAGSGFNASYSDGSVKAPAFGPLVVDDATFQASGSTVDALQVTGHPSLDHATEASLVEAAHALRSAGGVLSTRTSDRVRISRVGSDLPQTLAELRAQQSATRSMVLSVLVLSTTLALAALLLAGRLLGNVRETERGLLTSFGLARGQQVVQTLAETVLVAVAATVIAVPTAALTHSAITHLPVMTAAGLSQSPRVTLGLVITVVVGAVLLALALVIPAVSPPRPGRRAVVAARSGMDLLLVGIAVAAWWQLESQPSTPAAGDTTRTLAPVIFVAATTAIAVRCVPLLLGLVARVAARQTSLVFPLASSQAARRPYAGAALLLLTMATASATFGLTLQSTSERSARDQAALTVGTDLSLDIPGPATDREATAIAAATNGTVASAVVNRSIALGRYVGDTGKPPQLVAVDSHQAGALLRGRLDRDRTWSDVGALLAPEPAVEGLPLSAEGVEIRGAASSNESVGVDVTPTLVVQDATGFRRTVTADSVPLDGRPHHLGGLSNLEATRLIAARLTVKRSPGSTTGGVAALSIDLSVPAAMPGSQSTWEVQTLDSSESPVVGSAVTVERSRGETTIRTTAQVDLLYLTYASGDLLESAFETPSAVPVAVSQQLVDTVGVKVGGELKASIGGVNIPLNIAAIVPNVPSAPGQVAVLADADTLSRVLIGAGALEPVVDAWWVADPKPGTARTLSELELGDVTTRTGVAADLRQGPLRASFPAALSLLVGAAVVLLLAGAGLALGTEQPARSAEVARLRALGLPRADAIRLLLAEHGILLGLLILTGALVGAVTSLAVGPSLIRSDIGGTSIPTAVLEWPWVSEIVLVSGLLMGCLVIASAITVVAVRRSGSAQLRTADA